MSQLIQRIEMAVGSFNTTGTANTYIEVPQVSTRLNTADFDGTVTFYFEASLGQGGTTGQTAYVELYNKTDATSVTSSELTNTVNTGFTKYIRSGAITLSGDKIYTIRLKHSNSTINASIGSARIIVVQSGNITKTQIHQEIGTEGGASSTSSSNIIAGTANFLYEASKYDGSVSIRHDAVVKTTASNTVTSGIYDVTGASVVSSSEVTKTNDTNYTLLSSGNITLTDGHIYRPTAYVSAGAAVTFESSKLVFTITGGFTKFLAYMAVELPGTSLRRNGTSIYPNFNVTIGVDSAYDSSEFTGCSVATYFEGLFSINNGANTAYTDLEVYVNATSATSIVGTELSHTGDTSIFRARSSSFTFPAGLTELSVGVSSSSGTNSANHYNSYLILEVTGANGGANVSDNITVTDYPNSYSDNIFIRESVTIAIAAGTDLSVSVSDTITTSESTKVELNSFVNKSDSITITEATKTELNSNISVQDSITITESTKTELNSFINVSDSVSITESVNVNIVAAGGISINVSDNITLSENVTLLESISVSVSDSVTVTENVKLLLESSINVNDSVTITEALQRLLTSFIAVSDSITITEALTMLMTSFINVSDSVTVSENVNVNIVAAGSITINVSDSITVSESLNLLMTSFVNVSDSITITENVSVSIQAGTNLAISVSDSVTITENVQLLESVSISVSDSVMITESRQVTLESNISKSDSITITESIGRLLTSFIQETENITITENAQLFRTPLFINVSDSIVITESVTALQAGLLLVNKSDSITITESVSLIVTNAVIGNTGTDSVETISDSPGSAVTGSSATDSVESITAVSGTPESITGTDSTEPITSGTPETQDSDSIEGMGY